MKHIKRICKKHIGRPFDYRGTQGVINGRITEVRNRIATFTYNVENKPETYTGRCSVFDRNIIEIY